MKIRVVNIKAFTILESLIGLMLISIIIALTYQFINFVGKQMTDYQNQNAEEIEYNLFNYVITQDISKAVDYSFQAGKLTLKYYDGKTNNYNFNQAFPIRINEEKLDTFKVKITSYDTRLVNEDSLIVLSLNLKLLNSDINANYMLKKDISNRINKRYLNEN